MTTIGNNAPLQLTIHPLPEDKPGASEGNFWSGESPSFSDVLDAINPLQHIPIVSGIYRAITGDTISSGSKIFGDTLFGGPLGLLSSIFDSIIETQTGSSVTGNIVAAITGEDVPAVKAHETQTAANTIPESLSPKQRASYNAYVRASMLG